MTTAPGEALNAPRTATLSISATTDLAMLNLLVVFMVTFRYLSKNERGPYRNAFVERAARPTLSTSILNPG